MINVKNLSIKYGKRIILNDINLSLKPGDRVAILGKNGTGKTSLAETIAGVRALQKGTVEIDPIYKNNTRVLFQDVNFDSDLNLKQLFYFYLRICNIFDKELEKTAFVKYELDHVKNKKFKKLSGGEKQKFKLMLTLELKPKFLIVDEISTSLDYEWRSNVLKIIKNYLRNNEDVILLIISHDEKEIRALTDKYYLIEDQSLDPINNLDSLFKTIE
ncbi:ABC-2 type transport system ATP-binding protein [Mycoplasmoides fastidiosum]|uniref:ABC-2 type transport system ATP-binding protein n=1 Tax=Mycoplasmoides fastidiosum TaxID=92758 RepID=A0ABU0LZ16_9BACT|nr:ATP-binding cassette domain-containing protein [Mycoplasmoides fastidiosum]MDQ0513929.1 ABC-2 type transport system ATP-binding protein [Mycoplasmoides fastidiosum]UUD37657.1 ATP-binding cassette domain-containing protein [Mycoplasmoides fastidiosum]